MIQSKFSFILTLTLSFFPSFSAVAENNDPLAAFKCCEEGAKELALIEATSVLKEKYPSNKTVDRLAEVVKSKELGGSKKTDIALEILGITPDTSWDEAPEQISAALAVRIEDAALLLAMVRGDLN